jgi:hypothetical protein
MTLYGMIRGGALPRSCWVRLGPQSLRIVADELMKFIEAGGVTQSGTEAA